MSESTTLTRRQAVSALAAAAAGSQLNLNAKPASTPNIVLIVCDDLGHGDTSPYGGSIPTPNLKRMAAEGVRFSHFCTPVPICSASRAAWLTGRYPARTGVKDVYFPHSPTGLDLTETTTANMLKAKQYNTMCVGKWHLGDLPQYLPTSRGFDEYFGIPYSVDMTPRILMHNTSILEQETDVNTLTVRYTKKAVQFIQKSKDEPFFLYLAHSMPHIPQGVSQRFRGKSAQGLYGDVVEEIDWSVGEILDALKENGVDDNTLVMFSSDHGPWFQGSVGRLRGRKGMTYEGGVRIPFYARFPGRIPGGKVCHGTASNMDILPTVAKLCNASLPGKPLDGIDIWPLLTSEKPSVDREVMLFFLSNHLQTARQDHWKLHLARFNAHDYWSPKPPEGLLNVHLTHPELYDLDTDAQESYDVAPEYADRVNDMQARVESLMKSFPASVQEAWAKTKAMHNYETRTAALPRTVAPVKRS